jgi:hypothetical protein
MMDKQTLHFNLPDNWIIDFKLQIYEDEEIGESVEVE